MTEETSEDTAPSSENVGHVDVEKPSHLKLASEVDDHRDRCPDDTDEYQYVSISRYKEVENKGWEFWRGCWRKSVSK